MMTEQQRASSSSFGSRCPIQTTKRTTKRPFHPSIDRSFVRSFRPILLRFSKKNNNNNFIFNSLYVCVMCVWLHFQIENDINHFFGFFGLMTCTDNNKNFQISYFFFVMWLLMVVERPNGQYIIDLNNDDDGKLFK